MTGISERQSLTRERKVCRPGAYLRGAAVAVRRRLDAAEADLLREQNEGPERGRPTVRDEP